MLVDEPLVAHHSRDPIMMLVASFNCNEVTTRRLREGVYQVGHFGSSDFLRGAYEHYPELSKDDEPYVGCYGVCDDVDNLLEKCPMLAADPERAFVVLLTQVVRDPLNHGRGGGWRWRKWGEYIGKQKPTTEYLDDEPLIDSVFVYHVYERN